jgi:REP element-mobilizing transposase RayT
MHKHLRRLEQVWTDPQVYFITVCTRQREPLLANDEIARELVSAWRDIGERTGWRVGRYVIMPNHVHFSCWPADERRSLSDFVGGWKRLTTRRAWQLGHRDRVWQQQFFDHLLRSDESYGQKWEYVVQNPVRAGLCQRPEEWAYQGDLAADGQ